MNTRICLLLMGLTLMGCGSAKNASLAQQQQQSTSSPTGGSGSSSSSGTGGGSSAPVMQALATLQNNGSTVANVLSIGEDEIAIYIPSTKQYATIIMSTGAYQDGYLLFSGVNCTGNARAYGWTGPVGTSVVYGNPFHYLVTAATTTSFTYQSYTQTGTCLNTTSTSTPGGTKLGILSVINQPYNFVPLAPLTLTYSN